MFTALGILYMQPNHCLKLAPDQKEKLRFLFLAKWAESDGRPDPVDGSHATYHSELRDTLKAIGLTVEASGRIERMFEKPDCDFVVTLFNRAGFQNSEMLVPLLSMFHRVPFLGASPILRGLGDDKHLMKLVARSRGITTADWEIYRRDALEIAPPPFDWTKLVVKPNASSASWGIGLFATWDDARAHMEDLHAQGHDVIVEAYVSGVELALPVIGARGPWMLPVVRFDANNPDAIRSYRQKRHLEPSDTVVLNILKDPAIESRLADVANALMPELWPFDYGRLEFKYDAGTDTLNFIEINLSCNLWSTKATSFSARSLSMTHEDLIETILCHSLLRQGVVGPEHVMDAQ